MREEEFAAITLGEQRVDRIFEHLLGEILSELHQIHRILEPKFTLHIQQVPAWNYQYLYSEPSSDPQIQSID